MLPILLLVLQNILEGYTSNERHEEMFEPPQLPRALIKNIHRFCTIIVATLWICRDKSIESP